MSLNFSPNPPEQEPTPEFKFEIVTGAQITDEQISEFNRVWRIAFKKDRDALTRENIGVNDIHFLMHDLNNEPDLASAIGRFRKVEGIKIGDDTYGDAVWGRADIGVSARQGRGYGKALMLRMIDYAREHGMRSCVGLHGKMTTLNEFYEKCGLVVDYNLGSKIYRIKDGELVSLSGLNVSHFPNDPFIEAIKNCEEKTILPFVW